MKRQKRRTFSRSLIALLVLAGVARFSILAPLFSLDQLAPNGVQKGGFVFVEVAEAVAHEEVAAVEGRCASIIFEVLKFNLSELGLCLAIQGVQVITGVIKWVTLAVAWGLFELANGLVDFSLNMSSNITSGGEGNAIRRGYEIVLLLANIGLVAAIVIIAFLFMFRRPVAASTLVRFILVALLINFAFFAAVETIAVSDSIAKFINSRASLDPSMFQNLIAPRYTVSGPGDLLEGIAVELLSLVITMFFAALAVFVILALAAMFVVRFVALSILLVLLPLAILTAIFPKLSLGGSGNPFRTWVEQFTRWILFAPVAMFFVWLAMVIITGTDAAKAPPETIDLSDSGSIGFLAGMISALGMMLGGLIVANKMGITGAALFYGQVQKAGRWLRARGGKFAVKTTSAPLRSKAGKERVAKMQEAHRARLVQFAGRQLNVAGARAEQALQKSAKERLKPLAENPERMAQALSTLRGERWVEAANMLREKDSLGSAKNLSKAIESGAAEQLFRRYGRENDYKKLEKAASVNQKILQRARDGAEEPLNEAASEFVKTFKGADAKLLQGAIFADPDAEGFKPAFGLDAETHRKVRGAVIRAMLEEAPKLVANVRPKLNHNDFMALQRDIDEHIRGAEAEIGIDHTLEVREKLRLIREAAPEKEGNMRALYRLRDNPVGSVFGTELTLEAPSGGGGGGGGGAQT